MDKNNVTVIFTSCGRFDLLSRTIFSFIKTNTYPIDKVIIIDNSVRVDAYDIISSIVKDIPNVQIIINDENIGQVGSIDKAYSLVETKYIFHCEDDWEFHRTGFIEKSIDILETDPNIANVNIRDRFDGSKGSNHPIEDEHRSIGNNTYYLYTLNHLGVWHGFSWNPGLRRLSDYNSIKPYKQYNNEEGVGLEMKNLGFRSACLEESYCKHIGEGSITVKSNM